MAIYYAFVLYKYYTADAKRLILPVPQTTHWFTDEFWVWGLAYKIGHHTCSSIGDDVAPPGPSSLRQPLFLPTPRDEDSSSDL